MYNDIQTTIRLCCVKCHLPACLCEHVRRQPAGASSPFTPSGSEGSNSSVRFGGKYLTA